VVAALVRLRLLVLRNTLRRHTAQLVAVIIGAVYGLGIMLGAVVGLLALHLAPVDTIRTVVVLAGGVAVLGWFLLPLLATGIDETLEPSRLAVYPIPLSQLMTGLFLGGVLGVPGIVTTIAALATALSWVGHPGVALAALGSGALAAAICIVGSRAAAAVGSGLSTGRRFREARWFLIIVPLILAGPISLGATHLLASAKQSLGTVAEVVSWTPFGAAWAIPSSIAVGDGLGAVLRLLVALATLAVLVVVWRAGLARALVASTGSIVQGRTKAGLGFFRRANSATAAVRARALSSWARDPRYQRQLILIPLMPVLLGFYASLTGNTGFVLALGPVTAFFLALAVVSDVSYDSSAFTLHLATGVSGRADRAGRATAVLVFALPVVVVFTIGAAVAVGQVQHVPAILGLALGVLGSGLGVASVSSALIVLPVPAPGDNPFRSRPGANLTSTVQTFAVWGILGVLCLPEIVLLVAAQLTGSAVLGWIGVVVGVVLGAALFVVGVVWGGRILDRRGPELLLQLNRSR
jgi:ABC-2 type transport system permease protein